MRDMLKFIVVMVLAFLLPIAGTAIAADPATMTLDEAKATLQKALDVSEVTSQVPTGDATVVDENQSTEQQNHGWIVYRVWEPVPVGVLTTPTVVRVLPVVRYGYGATTVTTHRRLGVLGLRGWQTVQYHNHVGY